MPFTFSIPNPHLDANAVTYGGVRAEFNAWSDNQHEWYGPPDNPVVVAENAEKHICSDPDGIFDDAVCPVGFGPGSVAAAAADLNVRQFYRTFPVTPGPGDPPQHPLGYYTDVGVVDLVTVHIDLDLSGLPGSDRCTTNLAGAPACGYPADFKGYAGSDGELEPSFEVASAFTSWDLELDAPGTRPSDWGGWLRRTDAVDLWPYTDSANGQYLFRPEEVEALRVGVASAGRAYLLNLTWHVSVTGFGWEPGFGPPGPPPRLMMVI